MNQVKEHFEAEAHEFDQIMLKLIPYYPAMIDALVSAVPFESDRSIRVLDVGSGTGNITERVLRRFPSARGTCLDFSEKMIAISRHKLRAFPNVNFAVGDCREFAWPERYDAIVSSLALHHLETDIERTTFHSRAFAALNPGGCFWNADVIVAESESMQSTFLEKWKEFMRRSVSEQEIDEVWLRRYREEDHPVRLSSHLGWLKDAGFRDVDVIWKYYNFAVYGGVKA